MIHVKNDRPLRNVLCSQPDGQGEADIASPAQWSSQRERLAQVILHWLGEPAAMEPPRDGFRVLQETRDGALRRLKIAYDAEPGDEVTAWLLIPSPALRQGGAAILCQHSTTPLGKDEQIEPGKPGANFARSLAERGFITLAPDNFCAGERSPAGLRHHDTARLYQRHPDWSAVGKLIHDGRRALDVLSGMDEVDASRLGTVGHSLGGHGAFFLAAFDERVRACASSCGLCTWQDNERRLNWARDSWFCYIKRLRPVFLQGAPLPFDMHELAALVAPRAFLNVSGLADATYGDHQTLGDVALQLHAVWSLLANPDGFASFLLGGGHCVTRSSHAAIAAWFESWLGSESP